MSFDDLRDQQFQIEEPRRDTDRRREAPTDVFRPTPPAGGNCLRSCLIGCGVLFLLGAIAVGVGGFFVARFVKNAIVQDPIRLNRLLARIVPLQVPPGYAPAVGFEFTFQGFDFRMVTLMPAGAIDNGPQANKATIFLIAQGTGMDENALGQAMRQRGGIGPQIDDRNAKRSEVEVTVGDRKELATRVESVDDDGNQILQYLVMLRPGVMLIALGPGERFDQEAFESLLKSVETDDDPDAEEMPHQKGEETPEKPR